MGQLDVEIATYNRMREEFLELLQSNSRSIVLG